MLRLLPLLVLASLPAFAQFPNFWMHNSDGSLSPKRGESVLLGSSLQFLGATSSFPMFKRSTTTVQVRLADDSAYAGFTALSLAIGSDAAKFTVSSTGQTIVSSNLFASQLLTSFNDFGAGTTGAYLGSGKGYFWSSTTDATGTKDTGIIRTAAATIRVTDGSTGTAILIMKPPTSCSGLATGVLWNNSGTLAICP